MAELDLRRRAEASLAELTDVVRLYVEQQPNGARNDEVARELGLQSDINGGQRNHLTHAILNKLVAARVLQREQRKHNIYYVKG